MYGCYLCIVSMYRMYGMCVKNVSVCMYLLMSVWYVCIECICMYLFIDVCMVCMYIMYLYVCIYICMYGMYGCYLCVVCMV